MKTNPQNDTIYMVSRWLGLYVVCVAWACTKPDWVVADAPRTYLFLGHPYDWYYDDRIDPRLELLDFARFDGVWLGGDVCAKTSNQPETLNYLDGLFQLQSPNTHWTWGNHDLKEGDAARLRTATARPEYYTHHQDGLQVIVLNTNLFWHNAWAPPQEDCAPKAAQLAWLMGVLDTLSAAQHLVILHHHGLLNEQKLGPDGALQYPDNISGIPVRPDCRADGDFSAEVYPALVGLRQRGIPVTLIGGDVGMASKGYHYQTLEGITLLGSGINNSLDMASPPPYVRNFNPDTVLLVRHHPHTPRLEWSFERLSDVVAQQVPRTEWASLSPRLQTLLHDF